MSIDTEKLRALYEAASRARPDGDGDFSSYIKAEGALSRYLKECVPAILALAEERDRLATLARANNDLARHEANARRELQAENTRLKEALERWQAEGCPNCLGDCGSANPPVSSCIMTQTSQALRGTAR